MNLASLRPACAALVLASAGALAGCLSPTSPQMTAETSARLADVGEDAAKVKAQIQTTLASLKTATADAAAEHNQPLKQFSTELDKLHTKSDALEDDVRETDRRVQRHLRLWADDLLAMSDPDIRRVGETRRAALAESFATVQRTNQETVESVKNYLTRLDDVEKLLRNDFNSSGFDAASHLLDETRSQGDEVGKHLDQLIAKSKSLASEMTPAVAARESPPKSESTKPIVKDSKDSTEAKEASSDENVATHRTEKPAS